MWIKRLQQSCRITHQQFSMNPRHKSQTRGSKFPHHSFGKFVVPALAGPGLVWLAIGIRQASISDRLKPGQRTALIPDRLKPGQRTTVSSHCMVLWQGVKQMAATTTELKNH